MKLLFATENESKVKRFKSKLLKKKIELISIKDIDKKIDIEENGKDAIENALIKARAYAKEFDVVMAMDDSLYMEGVPDDKQPGLNVRRVNGKRLNDQEMIDYYSSLAHKYGHNEKILCRWVYGMAIINKGKEATYTWSKEDFYITSKKSDKIQPGYPLNSISINKKLNKYFTDITEEEKKNNNEDEEEVIEFICKNVLDLK